MTAVSPIYPESAPWREDREDQENTGKHRKTKDDPKHDQEKKETGREPNLDPGVWPPPAPPAREGAAPATLAARARPAFAGDCQFGRSLRFPQGVPASLPGRRPPNFFSSKKLDGPVPPPPAVASLLRLVGPFRKGPPPLPGSPPGPGKEISLYLGISPGIPTRRMRWPSS